MHFETIIFLIVVFNIVTAILQRRAKKKAREAEERAVRDGARDPATERRATRPEVGAAGEDDAFDEELRMPSLGRDILDQIARDLGLKTPKPEPVAAAERRAPPVERSVPAENRRAERPYVIPGVAAVAEAVAHASTAKEPGRGKIRGEAPARKIPGVTPVPRVNLRDPARLQEAFMVQEILGAPVSRRARKAPAA